MTPAVRLGATGFALIAVCYGLARFAFGLFLPHIRGDLSLSSAIAGFIAGGSFLGYCISIVISAALTERVGARWVAAGAGLVAAAGMAMIALANTSATLAAAVLFAGVSTGLASPPLAAAVAQTVRRERQGITNTVINAGTSAGVALSGPIAILFGADWRLAYGVFCAIALLVVAATLIVIGEKTEAGRTIGPGLSSLSYDMRQLALATFLMGAASTAVWSFGGELVSRNLGWGSEQSGILWVVIGTSGIAGSLAGHLCERFGLNTVHFASLAFLAGGIGLVGSSFSVAAVVFLGAALFGSAYIMLTGVYLVWGVSALAERPATGVMIGFLMIAVGQTAGAPIFGVLLGYGPDVASAAFATVALVAATTRKTVPPQK